MPRASRKGLAAVAPPQSVSRSVWPLAVIVLAGAAVFANSLRGAFVLDDLDAVVRNTSIRKLDTALAPPPNTTVDGRPVLNLTLAASYAVGRLDPAAYHVGNVLIHLGAALALFGLVRRVLVLPTCGPGLRSAATGTALVTALLWVVHPITTAAVSYTVQRGESLMGLLLLLTIYFFLRGAASERPGRWGVLAVLACALGMGTKEAMAVAPLATLLFDRTFLAGSFAAAWKRRRVLHLALASTWLLLAASIGASGGRGASVTMGSTALSPLHYAMTQCEWLVRYVGLVVWPRPLVFDYGLPDAGVTILRSLATWAPWGAALLLLAGVAVFALRRQPALGYAMLVAGAVLAPSSSIFPIVTEVAAEHRMYLPSAAIILVAVAAAGAAIRRAGLASSSRGRALIHVAVAVLVLLLGGITFLRNRDYRSAETLWRDTVAKRPGNARAHINLGIELFGRGDLASAGASFERALAIKADSAEAWTNRGRVYAELGQADRAIAMYDRALEAQPEFQPAFHNRAVAWAARGDLARAAADFARAIELNPFDPDPLVGRGTVKGRSGDLEGAIDDLSKAIAIAPLSSDAYVNRAAAYYQQREFDRAARDLEVAEGLGARLDPRFVDALARAMQGGR